MMRRALVTLALFLTSCGASGVSGPASDAPATVGGEVLRVTSSSVVIREPRSRTEITIDLAPIEARPQITTGDCILVSGQWKDDTTFTATNVQSVRKCE